MIYSHVCMLHTNQPTERHVAVCRVRSCERALGGISRNCRALDCNFDVMPFFLKFVFLPLGSESSLSFCALRSEMLKSAESQNSSTNLKQSCGVLVRVRFLFMRVSCGV